MPRMSRRTIEQTGKGWKALQLLSSLACIGGAITLIFAPEHLPIGILLLVIGIPMFLFARMGAWWFHG